MKRRDFLQISSLSLAGLITARCSTSAKYDCVYMNDMATGHLVYESNAFRSGEVLKTDYLIAGGGLAGLSAAYMLRNEEFLLCELSSRPGGTSSGGMHQNIPLCHGAHYELSYPDHYGKEGLDLLSELKIIQYDPFSNCWNFTDKQYLIPKHRESQTYAHGVMRQDVLPDGPQKQVFIDLVTSFYGKMPMPTRLIDEQYDPLNHVSFLNWICAQYDFSPDFIEGLDYHMKDDYGADAATVSALAGIHYFACRPYYVRPVELFSPPEGNSYFVNRLLTQLPEKSVLTGHLVKQISESADGFNVEIIDIKNKTIKTIECARIIYAGNKHALKYIYPPDYPVFESVEYAPWVVMNMVLKKNWKGRAFWQNEIISKDKSLLGFVDSEAQFKPGSEKRVVTFYYCFKPEERPMMSLLSEKQDAFIDQTVSYMESYFGISLKNPIEKVFIKQMGHAMPIPSPGYLKKNINNYRKDPSIVYAGVDTGRLPLLFEAIDSGIMAVKALNG